MSTRTVYFWGAGPLAGEIREMPADVQRKAVVDASGQTFVYVEDGETLARTDAGFGKVTRFSALGAPRSSGLDMSKDDLVKEACEQTLLVIHGNLLEALALMQKYEGK